MRALSFRGRILLVVGVLGTLPVALLALWVTIGITRSGETLLRERLSTALWQDVQTVEAAWVPLRSALLDLADSAAHYLMDDSAPISSYPDAMWTSAAVQRLPRTAVRTVTISRGDRTVWRMGDAADGDTAVIPRGLLPVQLPIFSADGTDTHASLSALVPLSALRIDVGGTALVGAVVSAINPATGALLLPAPFPPALLAQRAFNWNDEVWVVERAEVSEPRLTLVAAAPVAPFTAPLRDAARRGAAVLVVIALIGVVLTLVLTTRMTASLERVSAAAAGVAAGDLDRELPVERADEVGRLAAAFNQMTRALRGTLASLADRESLSAVNEFAAALAHEVRNPLTAIQLDLQEVEESLQPDSPLRPLQQQALRDLRALDRTVGAALDTARSGRVQARPIDAREPLNAAVHDAAPHAREKQVGLSVDAPVAARVLGDPDALRRVLLNVLLNAIEASPVDGRVAIALQHSGGNIRYRIEDNGTGMDTARLQHVFDPFYTTKPGGTGIGLVVARRIVSAHGGRITIDSRVDAGTTVVVTLRALDPEESGTN